MRNGFFSIVFDVQRKGKNRTFHDPGADLRRLIDEVYLELHQKIPGLKREDRIAQSKRDIKACTIFDHLILLDLKKALLNGNLLMIMFVMVLIAPSTINLIPKLIRIYRSPVYTQKDEIIKSNWKLKAGFKTSETLLAICFLIPLRVFNRSFHHMHVYVDDVAIYSNHKPFLYFSVFFLKIYFKVLGFSFHEPDYVHLKAKPRHAGGRLGIYFHFKNGHFITTVRPSTLKNYLRRIKNIVSRGKESWVIKTVGEVLYYDPDSYNLYSAFPKDIWTDPFDRNRFFSQVIGILKSRFKRLRRLSKEAIASLLWARLSFATGNLQTVGTGPE